MLANDSKAPVTEEVFDYKENGKSSFISESQDDPSPAPEYSEDGPDNEHDNIPNNTENDHPRLADTDSSVSQQSHEMISSTRRMSCTASQDSVQSPPDRSHPYEHRWDATPHQSTCNIPREHPVGYEVLIDQNHLPNGSAPESYAASVASYPQGRSSHGENNNSKASIPISQQSQTQETKEGPQEEVEKMTDGNDEEMEYTNPSGEDPETATVRNERILTKRKTLSRTRKCVIALSILVGILSVLATLTLLVLSESKKMARASFMTGTLLVELALGCGMWAGDMTIVEVLIGMNIVFVCGIFLTSNIDALMAENAF